MYKCICIVYLYLHLYFYLFICVRVCLCICPYMYETHMHLCILHICIQICRYICIYIQIWHHAQLSTCLGVVEGEIKGFRFQVPTDSLYASLKFMYQVTSSCVLDLACLEDLGE